MIKKLTALLLSLVLILLTAGCATIGINKKREYSVAILTGPQSAFPDEYSVSEKLASSSGVNAIHLADDFFNTDKYIYNALSTSFADSSVKAVIVANALEGTAVALRELRALRPDILVICCNPVEDKAELADCCDMVLTFDETAFGKSVAAFVKSSGADTLVAYNCDRTNRYPNVIERMSAIAAACVEAGIELDISSCVDYQSANGITGAQLFIDEDYQRKLIKHMGRKLAFFSNDPVTAPAVVKSACKNGFVLPVQPTLSPLAGFISAFSFASDTDSASAVKKIQSGVKKSEKDIAVQTATVSFPVSLIKAAVDYADLFCTGEISSRCDVETLKTLLPEASREIKAYASSEGDATENCLLISYELVEI